MAEKEQNAAPQSEEKQPEGKPTQQEETVPMSSYQELQRQLQRAKDAEKARRQKDLESASAEEQLAAERAEKAALEKELKVERIKAKIPADKHGAIDRFVEKYGVIPDAEDLAVLVPGEKRETTQQAEDIPQSSGSRNSPASRGTKPNFDDDDYLRSVKLDTIS